MDVASRADNARRQGNEGNALALFKEAFAAEYEAANLVPFEMEPTKSILLRSAASLAIECFEFREAERIIGMALAGNPPEEICEELRDLYETINFHRHLRVHGTALGPGELQFALSGDSVGFGLISVDEYFPRVQVVESMLIRTAERQRGIPFRERGRPLKTIRKDLSLYMSTARAASFAVTIRLGGPIKQQQLFTSQEQVVDEFLECVKLFESEQRKMLGERINDQAYLRNFVQLAKKIAPDGKRIRTIGFTVAHGSKLMTVSMRQPPTTDWNVKSTGEERLVQITGVLTEALKKKDKNTIGLEEESGNVRTIHVPKGLMADIVRPLWDRKVVVTGREISGIISLRGIEPFEDQS
jgi:hypothetical protein